MSQQQQQQQQQPKTREIFVIKKQYFRDYRDHWNIVEAHESESDAENALKNRGYRDCCGSWISKTGYIHTIERVKLHEKSSTP
jgi:hypothetical protein